MLRLKNLDLFEAKEPNERLISVQRIQTLCTPPLYRTIYLSALHRARDTWCLKCRGRGASTVARRTCCHWVLNHRCTGTVKARGMTGPYINLHDFKFGSITMMSASILRDTPPLLTYAILLLFPRYDAP